LHYYELHVLFTTSFLFNIRSHPFFHLTPYWTKTWPDMCNDQTRTEKNCFPEKEKGKRKIYDYS